MSEKRSAPISASAFAFSFTTPDPKSRHKKIKTEHHREAGRGTTPLTLGSIPSLAGTPKRPRVKGIEHSTPIAQDRPPPHGVPSSTSKAKPVKSEHETPLRGSTPLRSINQHRTEGDTKPSFVIETPKRLINILKPLGAFTTPLPQRAASVAGASEAGPSSSKTLKRINERVGDVTPLPPYSRQREDVELKPRFALQDTLLDEKMADDLFSKSRKAQLVEEDEGIGVSPRGKRIAKWSGRGALPPSVLLANLVSSSNASLHLFYTSMEHVLYPSHRTNTPRQQRQRPHLSQAKDEFGAEPSSPTKPTTPFQHIQNTALIRLRLLTSVAGPTHQSSVFWCEPLKWNSTFPPKRVLVMFQPLPKECPKLGVDPRLLASGLSPEANEGVGPREEKGKDKEIQLKEKGKRWQVGMWLWTEMDLPLSPEQIGAGLRLNRHPDEEEAIVSEEYSVEARRDQGYKPTTALLVTRYLIAEQPFA